MLRVDCTTGGYLRIFADLLLIEAMVTTVISPGFLNLMGYVHFSFTKTFIVGTLYIIPLVETCR